MVLFIYHLNYRVGLIFAEMMTTFLTDLLKVSWPQDIEKVIFALPSGRYVLYLNTIVSQKLKYEHEILYSVHHIKPY